MRYRAYVWLPCMFLAVCAISLSCGLPTWAESHKTDQCRTIAADELISALSSGEKFVLVDIRSARDFHLFHIPSSINIPLHEIRYKTFLKSKKVILFNCGGAQGMLLKACDELALNGFLHVSILAGGMVAWSDAGGDIAGDYFAISEMDELAPEVCFADRGDASWIRILIGGVKGNAEEEMIFPDAISVSCIRNDNVCLDFIIDSVEHEREGAPGRPVLIMDLKGQYKTLKRAMRVAGIDRVFYLKGGVKAYEKFLKETRLINESKHQEVRPCSSCP